METEKRTERDSILQSLRETTAGGVPVWWRTEPESGRPATVKKTAKIDPVKQFRDALEAVQGEFLEVDGPLEARRQIRNVLSRHGTGPVLAEPSPLLKQLLVRSRFQFDFCHPEIGRDNLAQAAVGIVEAQMLIAETGTVVVGSDYPGTRTLSLLPPTTILVAPASALVPDIGSALAAMTDRSNRVWITGPSRTADIEKVLVIGMHGPERLIVVLIHP